MKHFSNTLCVRLQLVLRSYFSQNPETSRKTSDKIIKRACVHDNLRDVNKIGTHVRWLYKDAHGVVGATGATEQHRGAAELGFVYWQSGSEHLQFSLILDSHSDSQSTVRLQSG